MFIFCEDTKIQAKALHLIQKKRLVSCKLFGLQPIIRIFARKYHIYLNRAERLRIAYVTLRQQSARDWQCDLAGGA